MKYQIKNDKLVLTETNSNDYTNLINILYGLNTTLSFKDNVIVNDIDTS